MRWTEPLPFVVDTGGGGGGTGGGGTVGGGTGGPGTGGVGGGGGEGYTVDLSDLRDDARFVENLRPLARELDDCWERVGELIQHWGLWARAEGPYTKGCSTFSKLYTGAGQELRAIGNALSETAAEYEAVESQGTATAGRINQ